MSNITRRAILCALTSILIVLLCGSAASSAAQVKRVQMHIAGYLCGN